MIMVAAFALGCLSSRGLIYRPREVVVTETMGRGEHFADVGKDRDSTRMLERMLKICDE